VTPPKLTSHRPLLGIALMLVSGTIMPVMNGFGKMLATSYPPEQVIWARLLTHLLWVLAFFLPRSGLGLFRTARPSVQLALSLCMLVSTTLFFFAVPHVGLAKASVINFVAPFMVMLLAVPMLGERLALRRFLAVAGGFAGVVVVIRPGFDALDWASIAILASSFFFALFQCYSRQAAAVDRPETSILYSVLAGAIVMSAVVPFGFVAPRPGSTARSWRASAWWAPPATTSWRAPSPTRTPASSRPSSTGSCSARSRSASGCSATCPTPGPGSARP
jgi:drug/metabolite transporter (DMT)-like permease